MPSFGRAEMFRVAGGGAPDAPSGDPPAVVTGQLLACRERDERAAPSYPERDILPCYNPADNRCVPRQVGKLGARPTRSRHCKRGARVPFWCEEHPSLPSLRRWEDAGMRVDPRVRIPPATGPVLSPRCTPQRAPARRRRGERIHGAAGRLRQLSLCRRNPPGS